MLEIGTYFGRTAALFALSTPARIVTVDCYGNGEGHTLEAVQGLLKPFKNVFPISRLIDYVPGDMLDFPSAKFIYVDGNRSVTFYAMLDYLFQHKLEAGGTMVCDDYGEKFDGSNVVAEAVTRLVAEHQPECVIEYDLACVRKP